MSTRFQVTLPVDLANELKTEARRMGITLADWSHQTKEEARVRQVKAGSDDPFVWMDGLVASSETDVSSRIDAILHRDDANLP